MKNIINGLKYECCIKFSINEFIMTKYHTINDNIHGVVVYYVYGIIKSISNWVNGQKHGLYTRYKNNKIQFTCNWVSGKLHGDAIKYKNGRIKEIHYWINDEYCCGSTYRLNY
jgi:antitoxin component YwqK of YwqJK toxin-antitoxin module